MKKHILTVFVALASLWMFAACGSKGTSNPAVVTPIVPIIPGQQGDPNIVAWVSNAIPQVSNADKLGDLLTGAYGNSQCGSDGYSVQYGYMYYVGLSDCDNYNRNVSVQINYNLTSHLVTLFIRAYYSDNFHYVLFTKSAVADPTATGLKVNLGATMAGIYVPDRLQNKTIVISAPSALPTSTSFNVDVQFGSAGQQQTVFSATVNKIQ